MYGLWSVDLIESKKYMEKKVIAKIYFPLCTHVFEANETNFTAFTPETAAVAANL